MGSTGVTLADLPNIFIMIAALAALFIMLVILLRNMEFIGIVGEGAHADTWHRAGLRPPRLMMQRVKIPFTFKLIDDKVITYSEVHCTVSSRVRYWMTSWWGAPINELHSTLWGTLSDILVSRQFVQSDKHEEKPLTLSCARAPCLGAPPRSCYPLVVILARDSRDTELLYPDDTVALVTIIHIKDDQCSNPSGILAQYLKQANGNLSSLKPLYLNSMGHVDTDMGNGQSAPADVCCVCASSPTTRALLPCRHACLCSDCLPKLDKCPMCRSIIDSYFCIRSDEEQLDMKQQAFSLNRRIFNLFHYH